MPQNVGKEVKCDRLMGLDVESIHFVDRFMDGHDAIRVSHVGFKVPEGALHGFRIGIDQKNLLDTILHAVTTDKIEEADRIHALPTLPIDDVEGCALKELPGHRAEHPIHFGFLPHTVVAEGSEEHLSAIRRHVGGWKIGGRGRPAIRRRGKERVSDGRDFFKRRIA